MEHKHEIVETTHAHMLELDEHLREADWHELIAADGPDTFHTILRACRHSSRPWTWLVDGRVAMIFGTVMIHSNGVLGMAGGSPWALGTDLAGQHPRALMQIARRYLRGVLRTYRYLTGYVDARNTTSVRWLKRLGFEILEPQPFGYSNLPFHKFEMRYV